MAQNNLSPKQNSVKDKSTSSIIAFIKDDLPLIRKALIVLTLSLSTSASLIGASRTIHVKLQDNLSQTQSQLDEVNGQLNQVRIDKQEIHDYQPKFIALQEQGFVGEERRLDWTEHIKFIQEKRKLLAITYEISAQQIFQPDPEVVTGDLELRGSKMELQMKLVHEGDLFNLLDDLKQKGFYTVQECEITRPDADTENANLPLNAECSIYWLTLGEPVANPEIPHQ